MSNSDFQSQWGYPSEIKTDLGAAYYELRPLPDNFRSGRPKWECLFFSADRKLVSRRLAMELVSKKTGKPYRVCARNEPAPPRAIRQQTNDADALLNELYAAETAAEGNISIRANFFRANIQWMFFPIVIISAVALYAVARQCCRKPRGRVSAQLASEYKDL